MKGSMAFCQSGVWKGNAFHGVTDLCYVGTGGSYASDAMCASYCGGTAPGVWRAIGTWDVDGSVGGLGRSSGATPSGQANTGNYMNSLCAKFY